VLDIGAGSGVYCTGPAQLIERDLRLGLEGDLLGNPRLVPPGVPFLLTHPESNGNVGVVGFCFGGGVANRLAAEKPELKAVVVYYGLQIPADQVPAIRAPLLLHYAELDERVNAKRRVIDISGDGDDDNIGPEVTEARNEAVAKGVTVNGMVVLDEPFLSEDGSPYPTTELERYFRDNVIGGPGAFVMVAQDFSAFGNVMLNKLIAEISGLPLTNTAANHVTKDVRETAP
jgi:hypothetical protein